MEKIKFILLLLICGSCTTNKSVVGLYGKCEKHYYACSQIELKSDNTFEYYIFMDVGGANTLKGNWEKISNDSIKLNTFNQPTNPKTFYTGFKNGNLLKKIKVSDKFGLIELANVCVNGSNKWKTTDKNGFVEFEVDQIKSISIIYLGVDEKINIDKKDLDQIDITLKDIQTGAIPEYLVDFKLKINNTSIYLDKKIRLKKTNLKNRNW